MKRYLVLYYSIIMCLCKKIHLEANLGSQQVLKCLKPVIRYFHHVMTGLFVLLLKQYKMAWLTQCVICLYLSFHLLLTKLSFLTYRTSFQSGKLYNRLSLSDQITKQHHVFTAGKDTSKHQQIALIISYTGHIQCNMPYLFVFQLLIEYDGMYYVVCVVKGGSSGLFDPLNTQKGRVCR